jgi:hypothetical protein
MMPESSDTAGRALLGAQQWGGNYGNNWGRPNNWNNNNWGRPNNWNNGGNWGGYNGGCPAGAGFGPIQATAFPALGLLCGTATLFNNGGLAGTARLLRCCSGAPLSATCATACCRATLSASLTCLPPLPHPQHPRACCAARPEGRLHPGRLRRPASAARRAALPRRSDPRFWPAEVRLRRPL